MLVQVPSLAQLPMTHSLPVLQLEQVPPPLPHAEASVPAKHVVPFQQPVQQLPLKHLPFVHGVLFVTLGVVHVPLEHTFV